MSAVAFDTLKLARKLRDTAQMSQVQAEGIADALAEAMSGAELATKGDIEAGRSELAAAKAELKSDIVPLATKADVAEAKADTLKAVMGMIIGALAVNILAMLGAMFGLAKLLGH